MSARYLTLAQCAERINVPKATVRYWIGTDKLRAFKPGRSLLVRESDLEAFVEASAVTTLRAARAKRARKGRAA